MQVITKLTVSWYQGRVITKRDHKFQCTLAKRREKNLECIDLNVLNYFEI